MSGQVLILAPHPDDEVVGFAASIGRHRATGGRAAVLFLTDGLPPAEAMWGWDRHRRSGRVARRRAEAKAACGALGTDIAGFLDIPSRRLKDSFVAAHDAVAAALARTGADVLWVPAYEGGHQDHDTASFLAARFARAGVAVREAPLYSFAGGRVRCQEFTSPPYEGVEEIVLSADEQREKRRLLGLYASETGNLDYVGLEREALRLQPVHDYSRPPHPGRTFYQRFQWVPFRHPRVDFTTPEQVCAQLMRLDRR